MRLSTLPSATQGVTELGLQSRTRWTLQPTVLVTDLSCKPSESVCELQMPFCFLHWAAAQEPREAQSPRSQAQAEWVGACLVRQRGEPLKRATPSDPPRLCQWEGGKADRRDHSLFYRCGNWASEGRGVLPKTSKWQSRDSRPVSWLNSKIFLPYHKPGCAGPRGPSWEAFFSSRYLEPAHPQREMEHRHLELPHPTAKPDYPVKASPSIAWVYQRKPKKLF